MAARTLRSCAHCGNEFIPWHWADPKYCSRQCWRDAIAPAQNNMTCLHCQRTYTASPCYEGVRKFCSNECVRAWKRHARPTHVACGTCGIEFCPITWVKTKYGLRLHVPHYEASTCSVECRNLLISKKLKVYKGPQKGAWKGGLASSHANYRGPKWAGISESVRKRDGYKCQRCGCTQDEHIEKYRRRLPVHHIVPFHNFQSFRQANRRSNLTTLCNDCHMVVEYESPEVQMTFCFYENKSKSRPGLATGSRHGQAKVTESVVVEIRRRYRNGEMATDLAKEFAISHSAMALLIDGRTWTHVPNPVPLRGRKEAYVAKRVWLESQKPIDSGSPS